MSEEQINDSLIDEFAAIRIAVWEAKHGLLTNQGRACINTIISCAMKADPKALAEAIKKDKARILNLAQTIQQCYCEYLRQIRGETDSE